MLAVAKCPQMEKTLIAGVLPAGAELNPMSADSLCSPRGKGSAGGETGCSWNTTALWLSSFVTRVPGVLARW